MTRPDQRAAAVEAMARAIAHGLGDAYESAFMTKNEWNRARGNKGGRFRDINEPMQSDFNEAGKAALAALHDAGFAVVPREATAEAIVASVVELARATDDSENFYLSHEDAVAAASSEIALSMLLADIAAPAGPAEQPDAVQPAEGI